MYCCTSQPGICLCTIYWSSAGRTTPHSVPHAPQKMARNLIPRHHSTPCLPQAWWWSNRQQTARKRFSMMLARAHKASAGHPDAHSLAKQRARAATDMMGRSHAQRPAAAGEQPKERSCSSVALDRPKVHQKSPQRSLQSPSATPGANARRRGRHAVRHRKCAHGEHRSSA